jgi:hypothetical protein
MYVRWQHKPLKDAAPVPDDVSHRAYLLLSKRRDGRPRVKIIAYLGSLRSSQVQDDQARQAFLDKAHTLVERHCRDALQRKAAWAKLAEIVAVVDTTELFSAVRSVDTTECV